MTLPLEHLDVWEGRGTSDDIVMDYISTGYLDKHLGVSAQHYDHTIIRGILTQEVFERGFSPILDKFYSTLLFRQLQVLILNCEGCNKINILPYLEQIRELTVYNSTIPAYSLNIDLPLVHTLQYLKLLYSSCPWMSGRVFKALKWITIDFVPDDGCNDPQPDTPACIELEWNNQVAAPSFFCVNLQKFSWINDQINDMVDLRSLFDFLLNCSHLQHFDCVIDCESDSVIQFVFCDAQEQGVWKDIRSVEVELHVMDGDALGAVTRKYEHAQHVEKWWKEFTFSSDDGFAIFKASM